MKETLFCLWNVRKALSKSKIFGLGKLRIKLSRMPKEIQREVEAGLRDGANLVFRDAQANVRRRFGLLADAMKLKRGTRGLSFRIGYWKSGNIRNWRKAGWRAKFIEFGTRNQRAFPFMGRAYSRNEKPIISRINRGVDRALKRAANL